MPILAVWSKERADAPFVCLEPWCGRCDRMDFNGNLADREYNTVLEAGEVFNNVYSIGIN